MVNRTITFEDFSSQEQLAKQIVVMASAWRQQRTPWVAEQKEKRNFIFATDTSTTTASETAPWRNTTTIPKLTQIRDNLHANLMSAIFPNDNWLRWEAYTEEADEDEKREAIQAYMDNKVRESNFRYTISQLLYDYIDYGNAFADVTYVRESIVDEVTGETIPGYEGPKIVRLSPFATLFDPTASSYSASPKITRYIYTLGELENIIQSQPDTGWITNALSKAKELRSKSGDNLEKLEDIQDAYYADGFGSLSEYLRSGKVELLEYEGDIYDEATGVLRKNIIITVLDGAYIVRDQQNPSWLNKSAKKHVGWRLRPDNLYAMGPLDNLTGMQFKLDQLQNAKSDALDQFIMPPIVTRGDVSMVEWGPYVHIHIEGDGAVDFKRPDMSAILIDQELQTLQTWMEELAGAPKEAMGIRSPGEKTAFEVQTLQNASSRIFQEKATTFETQMLEPLLNTMLEYARRNITGTETVRVMDDDLGVLSFLKITKEDITARGKLRPIGARHFAQEAQLMQNLVGTLNSAMGQLISPHISRKKLAKLIESSMGLDRFALISDNIGIIEDGETQRIALQDQAAQDMEAEVVPEGPQENV